MAQTKHHIDSEIQGIETDLIAREKSLSDFLKAHSDDLAKLHTRKAHLSQLRNVLGDAGASTEANQGLDTGANAGTAAPAKQPSETAVEARTDAAPKTRKARGPNKNAKAPVTAKARGKTAAAATPSPVAAKTGRGRKATVVEAAGETQATGAATGTTETIPASGTQAGPAHPPLTLKALDVLRHAKSPMNSGDIAKEIGVAPRGMGPIMKPLTNSGDVTRSAEGRYELAGASASGTEAAAH